MYNKGINIEILSMNELKIAFIMKYISGNIFDTYIL